MTVTSKPSHSGLAATLPTLLLLAGLGLPSTTLPADAPAATNARPAVATTNGTPAVTSMARAATNTTAAVTNLAPAITRAPSATDSLTTNDWESALRILHSTLESFPPTNPKSAVRRPPPAIDPPSTNLIASTNSLDDKRKLAIGDRLSLRIVEDQEDSKPLLVTDSGDVEVPYIGRVPALNKTCHQLAQQIKAKLEEEYYYQATVIIAVDQFSKNQGKVYLVGYVRMPGPQEIPGDEEDFTLSKAIMRAGGFGEFADKKHVKVTRKGGPGEPANKTIEVNVGAILEEGKTENDIKVEPGDLIYVSSRLFKF